MNEQSRPQPDPQPHDETHDDERDTVDDPAHSTGDDEGWASEGGATPAGPATDADSET